MFLKSLLKLQENDKSGKLEPKEKRSLIDNFNDCEKTTEVSHLEIVSIYNIYIKINFKVI